MYRYILHNNALVTPIVTPSHSNLSKISQSVKSDVAVLPIDCLINLLLFGSKAFDEIRNDHIMTKTILVIYESCYGTNPVHQAS